jgi:hypothetical protein
MRPSTPARGGPTFPDFFLAEAKKIGKIARRPSPLPATSDHKVANHLFMVVHRELHHLAINL